MMDLGTRRFLDLELELRQTDLNNLLSKTVQGKRPSEDTGTGSDAQLPGSDGTSLRVLS